MCDWSNSCWREHLKRHWRNGVFLPRLQIHLPPLPNTYVSQDFYGFSSPGKLDKEKQSKKDGWICRQPPDPAHCAVFCFSVLRSQELIPVAPAWEHNQQNPNFGCWPSSSHRSASATSCSITNPQQLVFVTQKVLFLNAQPSWEIISWILYFSH